jgi:hypothetical protein
MTTDYRVSCMYGPFNNIKNIIKEFREEVVQNINSGGATLVGGVTFVMVNHTTVMISQAMTRPISQVSCVVDSRKKTAQKPTAHILRLHQRARERIQLLHSDPVKHVTFEL